MIKQILVPDIGSAAGVSVIEILVNAGDFITKEASLITLETDKATMEIPSPYEGKIESINIKVGDKVSEGDLILTLEVAGSAEGKNAAAASAVSPASPSESNELSKDASKSEQQIPAVKESENKVPKAEMAIAAQSVAKAEETLQQQTDKPVISQPVQNSATAGTITSSGQTSSGQISTVHAGPAVRRFARELGVDLSRVLGTGRKGRIVATDVKNFVKQSLSSSGGAAGQVGSSAGQAGVGLNLAAWPSVDHAKFGEITIEPLSRIKKLSGAYLHRNWVMVPHVTQFDEADITELEAFRKESQSLAEQQGVKLTPLVFIMKAVVASLKAFPDFNASLDASGTQLILKKYFHLGVAVDTPNGLVVPVVRDVDQKGLFQLALELGELSNKARKGQLTALEMQGSSFSISSLGGIGGTAFTPIVNVPDVAILGVSKAQMKPIYTEGEFRPCLMLPLSLSYDHRVIDGAQAARFTTYLVKQLSDIRRLLL